MIALARTTGKGSAERLERFEKAEKFEKRTGVFKKGADIISVFKKGAGIKQFDIILVTAEYYDDHPFSPAGIIARVLDAKGYSVGIIEKPETKEDFCCLGSPRLFFGVTSGSIDSMLHNYTPLKKKRSEDKHSKVTRIPDRAVIFYCNKLREYFKACTLVIGGIEASLRRFAHYDYWDNKIRRSILLDSRADILVFGNGEKQVVEIADRLNNVVHNSLNNVAHNSLNKMAHNSSCHNSQYGRCNQYNYSRASGQGLLNGIRGTCVVSKELVKGFKELPSFSDVSRADDSSKQEFCRMQAMFSNNQNLAQKYNNNYVLQYKFPEYTTEYLDWIYGLGFTRGLHPRSLLKMARFSVVTHRGCIGKCSFCSIALHQGDKIISRSKESILAELKRIAEMPDFRGYIDDLGGPSANMYGMDSCNMCRTDHRTDCFNSCIECNKLDMVKSHSKIISLLRRARKIKGIKKIFVRSGIRYDLAMSSEEYIKELSEHHVSGSLKIAPEHFSQTVLKLMNKDNKNEDNKNNSLFEKFVILFNKLNKPKNQYLKYYFMLGHPGDDPEQVMFLKNKIELLSLKNIEAFQLFTPTPMTVSTCMYWTGLNPFTLEKVRVVHDYNTKKKMKRSILKCLTTRMRSRLYSSPVT